MKVIPGWMIKALVTTIIGTLITGFSAWGVHLSARSNDHEARLKVAEDHQKGIDQSLIEIKQVQRDQTQDLKEILKRLPRR